MKITHKTRADRNAKVAYDVYMYIMSSDEQVHVNSLYELIGNKTFSSPQYFVRCFLDIYENSPQLNINKKRSVGTYANRPDREVVLPLTFKQQADVKRQKKAELRTQKKAEQQAIMAHYRKEQRKVTMPPMFGADGLDLIGNEVDSNVDTTTWNELKNPPKFIRNKYDDTDQLFRMQGENEPPQYIQVTKSGKRFHYKSM